MPKAAEYRVSSFTLLNNNMAYCEEHHRCFCFHSVSVVLFHVAFYLCWERASHSLVTGLGCGWSLCLPTLRNKTPSVPFSHTINSYFSSGTFSFLFFVSKHFTHFCGTPLSCTILANKG